MKNNLISVLIVCLLFCLFGCVEEFDLNGINGTSSNRLVIEGLITDELKMHTVILTRVNTAIPTGESQKVSNAFVEITDGINVYPLSESVLNPGIYFTEDRFKGKIGETYILNVIVDNMQYSASAYMEPVEPFEPFEKFFQPPNRIGNPIKDNFEVYDLSFPKVRYGTAEPSKQVFSAFDSVGNRSLEALFYDFPKLDPQGFLLNFSGFNPTLILKPGSIITQSKYSMSQKHYEFIRAVYSETRFKGGIFDAIPGDVPTNITNDGLGFFAASAVITRTYVVSETDLIQ